MAALLLRSSAPPEQLRMPCVRLTLAGATSNSVRHRARKGAGRSGRGSRQRTAICGCQLLRSSSFCTAAVTVVDGAPPPTAAVVVGGQAHALDALVECDQQQRGIDHKLFLHEPVVSWRNEHSRRALPLIPP